MRILFSAVLAASFAAASLPALAQTATPVKDKACKYLKDEGSCSPRKDCNWMADKKKCTTAPKAPKTT